MFSHVQLCDLLDGSPPGSSVHGIFQARILERVTIPFSRRWGGKELTIRKPEQDEKKDKTWNIRTRDLDQGQSSSRENPGA